jgi:hypothetical protein
MVSSKNVKQNLGRIIMTRVSMMILVLLISTLSANFTFADEATVKATPTEKIFEIGTTVTIEVHARYKNNVTQRQEAQSPNCQWKYVGATAYSDEQCTTEDSTVVSATTTADTEWVTQKCYKKNVAIKGLKAGVNWVKFRMKYRLNTASEGTEVISNAVKVIVYDIGFIDNIPDYSLDSNKDSDNFFLRQHGVSVKADYKDIDIYYYILPTELKVNEVKIVIRKEADETTSGVVETLYGEQANGQYKTGAELNVKWSDVRVATTTTTKSFRDNSFYTVQLEVAINGVEETFKTPLGDADTTMPTYQCKEKCLVIHDLVYKHRPAITMSCKELVVEHGPVYPFSDKIVSNYKFKKKGSSLTNNAAWADTPATPNYSTGSFPTAATMPIRQEFTYLYPVLKASIDNDATGASNHYIEIGRDLKSSTKKDETLFHRGHISRGNSSGNYCFIRFWMFEPASYAPYNVPFYSNAFIHQGDWEMVQLCIKLTGIKKSDWFRPHAATASQHYYGQTLAWRIDKNGPEGLAQEYVGTEDNGNRVKIYIAENSHATYFREGNLKTDSEKCGTQIQYEAAIGSSYQDKISKTLNEVKEYDLIPLNYQEKRGIGDWPGKWGKDGWTSYSIAPAGPFLRQADIPATSTSPSGKLTLQSDPKTFHNLCRKLIGGIPQPETEL